MRFSTIFVYLAFAAGLAIAGPVADRGTGLTLKDAGNSTQPTPKNPKGQKSPIHAGPKDEEKAKIHVIGKKGVTTTKREDHNPLDERGHAILYLCQYRHCNDCDSYDLEDYEYDMCYWAYDRYYSVYVWSWRRLHYGVYAGYYYYPECRGTFSTRSFTYLFGTL
jgi:hypothetical protein